MGRWSSKDDVDLRIDRLEHVQPALPAGGQALRRAFYEGP